MECNKWNQHKSWSGLRVIILDAEVRMQYYFIKKTFNDCQEKKF